MESLSKSVVSNLIKSNSPNVTLVNTSKICIKRPDIFQIEHNGSLLRNLVYCKRCDKVVTLSKGSIGNLSRHCKSHSEQKGAGMSEDIMSAAYHYPGLNQTDTNTEVEMAESEENDVPDTVTSATLRFWKYNNMLPPEPDLAIRQVIKVEVEDGIPMAHVKWSDPNFHNTWIPVRNLKRYYIYDTDILYEDDSDEDAHKSKHCHLSVQQRRAIKRMKRQKQPIKSK